MSKEIELGDHLPDISLKNQAGDLRALAELKGNKAIVVYFYPKDDTPGCTAQACSFRDSFEEFTEAGAEVVGISGDSVASHEKFAKKHRLNFNLLSDSSRKAEKSFGVPRNLFGMLPGRVTYVFNRDSRLIKKFNSAMNISKHIKESIKALQSD